MNDDREIDNPVADLIVLMNKERLNRDSILKTAYLGKPPARLDNESEAELPNEPRFKPFREKTHEEEAAEEKAKEKSSKTEK